MMLTQVNMGNKYNQLGLRDRDLIATMLASGKSMRMIAGVIGRRPSTVSREIRRNMTESDYLSGSADEESSRRRSDSRKIKRLKENRIRSYVRGKLMKGWSPELIAGRLRRDHIGLTISHEAIYQWIYAEGPHYIPCLVRSHRIRRPRQYQNKHKKHVIPGRVSIEERPVTVVNRKEPGHWESDTALFRRNKSALHVMTERKTRFSFLTKVEKNEAIDVRSAILRHFTRFPRVAVRRTITYDNGKENTCHHFINIKLGTRSYFCHPYCSWEKGTVENTIGLVRRRLPKKIDFVNVSRRQVKYIQDWLNHRPRKCLNYQTPSEVFQKECCT